MLNKCQLISMRPYRPTCTKSRPQCAKSTHGFITHYRILKRMFLFLIYPYYYFKKSNPKTCSNTIKEIWVSFSSSLRLSSSVLQVSKWTRMTQKVNSLALVLSFGVGILGSRLYVAGSGLVGWQYQTTRYTWINVIWDFMWQSPDDISHEILDVLVTWSLNVLQNVAHARTHTPTHPHTHTHKEKQILRNPEYINC